MSVTDEGGLDVVQTLTASETATSAEDGEGGGNMPLWEGSREDILNSIMSSSGNFSINTDIIQPSAVVDVSSMDTYWHNNEKSNGISSSGEAIDPEGGPLTGSVSFVGSDSGNLVSSKNVSGEFSIYAGPYPGVATGANSESVITKNNLSIRFKPSFSGLYYESQDLDSFHAIQYSGVEGYVKDAQGNPVESVPVIGSGDSAVTNEDGYYSLLAPQNTPVDLTSIGRTISKSVTVGDGSYKTVDWQFAGMRFRVLTPLYEPIAGAPVEIDGEVHKTNEDGEVVFPLAGLGQEYDVRVFDSDDFEDIIVAPDTEGTVSTTIIGTEESSFSGGSGGEDPDGPYSVSIRTLDISSGRPITEIDMVVDGKGIRTSTGPTGYGKMVIPSSDTGTETITVGGESKRYRKSSINVDLVSGDTVSKVVRLQKETETVNF